MTTLMIYAWASPDPLDVIPRSGEACFSVQGPAMQQAECKSKRPGSNYLDQAWPIQGLHTAFLGLTLFSPVSTSTECYDVPTYILKIWGQVLGD